MFKKNIESLQKINKCLANRISNISLSEASKNLGALKNEKGEYILTQNDKYIDDVPSPTQAAKELYSQNIINAKTRHDFILIFGLGLGNLLDYTHEKSISNIILYEPDLNILRFTFEYVDLTKYFADGRLYVSNNIADCTKYIEEKYLLDDQIEFLYLKNYLMLHASEFKVLSEKILEVCQNKIMDLNTTKQLSKFWVENTIKNAFTKQTHYPINILENKFKGKTALILGAGPSLNDNIEKIKKYRDKFVIFAVHRTLETLKNSGITPDFCVIIDANWVNEAITKDADYLKQINFISDIKADSFVKTINANHHFTYYSKNSIYSEKLQSLCADYIRVLETGGTSTICAYRSAKFMGFKNIIFAGIDLVFKNDTAYCDGKIASVNDATTLRIQNVIMPKAEVKTITGEYTTTRADYANFIKQFEIIFAQDKYSNIYNISSFGAFINGMKYVQLEDITETDSINSKDIIEKAVQNNTNVPEKIYSTTEKIFREEQKKLKPIVDLINEWFEMYSEHPGFFDYATKIITKITSTMILQDCVQIELIKFYKLVLSEDKEAKNLFVNDLFKTIIRYNRNLDNLI